jgi:hypothetical protein
MGSIQEIERAIAALSPLELQELYAWMDRHCPQPIDEQLQADLQAGRLDARITRALADHKSGSTRSL